MKNTHVNQSLCLFWCIFFFRVSHLLIYLFTYCVMYWIYASWIYLIYEFLSIYFFKFFLVYSNYSNFIATHSVGIHTWAQEQPVAAGTQRLIMLEYIGYKGSLQNSRNMYTYTYGDKCVWKWKRREVRIQIDARIRIHHKNGNAEGSGG